MNYKEYFEAFGYTDNDIIYLRTFHDRKEEGKYPLKRECKLSNINEVLKELREYNKDNYGVFFVVNGGGQKKEEVKITRAHFIEMDEGSFEEQTQKINSCPLEPSIVIKTRKSLHCYWLVDYGDIGLFEKIQNRMIAYFGSDPAVKDPSRVMRLPGFYHCKEEPIMVNIVKFNKDLRYMQHQLMEVFPEVKEEPKSKNPISTSKDPITSHRHNHLISLIGSLKNKGMSDEAITSAIVTENNTRCCPLLTEFDMDQTIFPAIRRWENKVVFDNGKFRPVAKNDYNLKSAKDVMEKEPEWLIMGYIPKYGMTSLAGEGGTGKTSVVGSIVASVTTGSRSFLEGNPFNDKYEPGKVIIFSAEDSWEYVLKKRLISCGADLDKVLYMGPEDERFVNINFNSEFLGGLIEHHKPDLVIFDPVQAFVPENFRMGDRNAMRKCFSPLIGYGEKYGTTFIIVVHANKQSGVWGRKRMADSSDIWDASRSVLMLGNVPNSELRYISHEKSNWGAKQQSVIFELNECVPEFKNHTTKKDKDFVLEESKIKQNNTSSCDLAKDFIISTLCEHKQMEVKELDELAKASGISTHALKDAKAELNKEKQVHTWSIGYGKDKKYYITLKDTENTDE